MRILSSSKRLSITGLIIACLCFVAAALLHPGGYDLSRDYLSTLLRDRSAPARITAIAGLLFYCVSIALVFVRLARVPNSRALSKVIEIGGIGSAVYTALVASPMHDLMVTISIIFFATAVLALLRGLHAGREIGFLAAGSACFALLVTSCTIYYSHHFVVVLPWAQRILLIVSAAWLVSLDLRIPRLRLGRTGIA
jgi:hypothetical protein